MAMCLLMRLFGAVATILLTITTESALLIGLPVVSVCRPSTLPCLNRAAKLEVLTPPPFREDGSRPQACLALLPQGWTWSVRLAHKTHEHLIRKGSDAQ